MSPFRNYWTRKSIISGLLWLHKEVERIPTVKDVRAYSKSHADKVPSYSTVIREFEAAEGEGNPWQKALQACGLDTTYSKRGRRPKGYAG